MNRPGWNLRLGIVLLFVTIWVSGCAFGSYGKADVGSFDIHLPSGLIGQSKMDVVKQLGVPNSNINVNGTDYWRYNNKGGFFILLYGNTKEKDLVLEFKEDKVASNYLLDKGSSMGIFAPQGAVGN